LEKAKEVAGKYGAEAAFASYSELLAQDDLDGVILATPTQMHHAQTLEALRAGKNVMVEIPMADSLAGVQEIVDTQKETGLIAMAGHTRRFNPSHQYVHNKISAGEFGNSFGEQAADEIAPLALPGASETDRAPRVQASLRRERSADRFRS
jgi:2-hydroxy-4-carboxymuconate semialdehyde hemiacetal dehydrogenase